MEDQDIYYAPVVSNTIMLVAKNIDKIKECKGKNLVVFIGREQVGKSTTINALLGTKFQVDQNNERILVPQPGEQIHAPMGSDEKSGLMCTVFPAVYKDGKDDFYYLDTQGFFGTDKNPDEVAAASILLDAAIKSAASVKIVYIEDFEIFYKGYTRVQDAVKLLNRVVLSNDVPIYCLYNRYSPPIAKASRFYKASEEEQNEIAKEELDKISKKLVNAAKENSEKLLSRLKNVASYVSGNFAINASTNAVKRTISNDSSHNENQTNESNNNDNSNNNYVDFTAPILKDINETSNDIKNAQEAYKIEKCAQLIEFNFEAGRYGYINALSDWSINYLRQSILQLPTIDKSKLSFNCCDEKRIRFAKDFEETLRKFIDSINNVYFSLRFPISLINELLQKNKSEKDKNQQLLDNLNKGIEIDSTELVKDLKDKKEETRKALRILENELSNLGNQTFRIQNASPVKYYDHQFDEPASFFKFWRDYTVIYKEPIPFVTVEEYLAEGTYRDNIIDFDINKFDAYWDDENKRTVFNLKNGQNPLSNFEVSYTSATKAGKARTCITIAVSPIIGGVLGFLGLTPLCIPVGSAIGATLKRVNCTGVISFYVRYQDRESDSLNKIQNDKEKIKKLISEKQAEFERIDSNIKENTRQILTSNISQCDVNIEKLEEILNFVTHVSQIWESRKEENEVFHSMNEELAAYNEISQMLYPPPIKNESVKNFIALYKRLESVSNESQDVSTIKLINEYKVRNVINVQ